MSAPVSDYSPDYPRNAAAPSMALVSLSEEDLPLRHPVRMFAGVYWSHVEGHLLPSEDALLADPDAAAALAWARLIEPVEVDDGVDFYVIDQGAMVEQRSSRYVTETWMSDTVDPQFVESRYRSTIAAAVLRKPMYGRGPTPDARRSFLTLLRGVFPVFANNQPRLRLLIISAPPYEEV